VQRRLAILGGIGVALAALWRTIRRRPAGWVEPEPVDPRAEELRKRLEESRPVVEEREKFEAAETTVDAVEATPEDPDARRRAVHAEGRSTVEEMKGTGADT
jgi:hypothetical protein